MVDSQTYWRERELEHIRKQIRDEEILMKQIRERYLIALDEIQKQIEAFYARYAQAEGITMEEARKRVRKLEIEEYERKAKRYVKEHNFSERANAEMRIYNLTMRVNRLELLKLNIELELLALVSEEERFFYEQMTQAARKEYERQSGILGQTINHNEQNIAAIVNSSFLNATWSDRLWTDQVALRAELNKLLHRGIVRGLNPRELARDLRKVFNTSIYNSERLLRTEMARVQQDVFQDSMKRAKFDAYEYIAEPDACDICKKLDGKIFRLEEAQVGVNAYPMHPNCKCSQAAAMDRNAWEADLRARGL